MSGNRSSLSAGIAELENLSLQLQADILPAQRESLPGVGARRRKMSLGTGREIPDATVEVLGLNCARNPSLPLDSSLYLPETVCVDLR